MEGQASYCEICGKPSESVVFHTGRSRAYCNSHLPHPASRKHDTEKVRNALKEELEAALGEMERVRNDTVEVVAKCFQTIERQIRMTYEKIDTDLTSCPFPCDPALPPVRLLRVSLAPSLLQVAKSISETFFIASPSEVRSYLHQTASVSQRKQKAEQLFRIADEILVHTDDTKSLLYAKEACLDASSMGFQKEFAGKLMDTAEKRMEITRKYEEMELKKFVCCETEDVAASMELHSREVAIQRNAIMKCENQSRSLETDSLQMEIEHFPNLSAAKRLFGSDWKSKEYGESLKEHFEFTLEKTNRAKSFYESHFPLASTTLFLTLKLSNLYEYALPSLLDSTVSLINSSFLHTSIAIRVLKLKAESEEKKRAITDAIRTGILAVESCFPYTPFADLRKDLCVTVGKLYGVASNREKEVEWMEKAYLAAEEAGDAGERERIISDISAAYMKMGNAQEAEKWECLLARSRKRLRSSDVSLPSAGKLRRLFPNP